MSSPAFSFGNFMDFGDKKQVPPSYKIQIMEK
jgi:hypothetical protein